MTGGAHQKHTTILLLETLLSDGESGRKFPPGVSFVLKQGLRKRPYLTMMLALIVQMVILPVMRIQVTE